MIIVHFLINFVKKKIVHVTKDFIQLILIFY